jgi:hypothetical protein
MKFRNFAIILTALSAQKIKSSQQGSILSTGAIFNDYICSYFILHPKNSFILAANTLLVGIV